MEETTLPTFSSSSSNEVSTNGDVEDVVQQWLENEALPGFRIWQLAGIVLSVLLSIVVGLCCCIRFRVPRTKQEIEADYIRKRITKSFRNELSKISNTEMDDMDLQKGNDATTASEIDSYEDSLWTESETSTRRTRPR
ncbi:uncharacterized protein LOC112461951 isoform X2 [Temnothorax curvispinosus]|uniref:Uncharacterized protein LOC112461951 isoform X2 n=1 Tax=Temnothorax curvispinosus TaxID=300111 RepID=A0A6J1QMM8_9HYME|nr:uncharacterized protein LOC112461951 isoform X2 [Temnothorax curvispinosus]